MAKNRRVVGIVPTFTQKSVAETEYFIWEFRSLLNNGESISSITSVTPVVYSGVDASPNAIKSGAASISGTTVKQLITGGLNGVTYDVTVTVVTSSARSLSVTGRLPMVT